MLFALYLEVLLKLLSLLLDVLGHLIVNISEKVINGWLGGLDRVLESLTDGGTCFFTESGCVLSLDETATGQVLLLPLDERAELGEQLFLFLHLYFVTIALREVTGGMITYMVGDGLNKRWSLFFDNNLSSLFACVVDGKDVISIDSDSWHPVCDTSNSDTISGILIINRCGNGIHIVSAEEHRLASQCGSEIQGGMEITFRGSTFSEISNGNSVLA